MGEPLVARDGGDCAAAQVGVRLMAARIVLDRGGIRALLNDGGVRAEVARRADAVAAAARAIAPVDTGAYQQSITRVSVTTDRAVERVAATVRYARVVEAKTGTLARALNAAGGS